MNKIQDHIMDLVIDTDILYSLDIYRPWRSKRPWYEKTTDVTSYDDKNVMLPPILCYRSLLVSNQTCDCLLPTHSISSGFQSTFGVNYLHTFSQILEPNNSKNSRFNVSQRLTCGLKHEDE